MTTQNQTQRSTPFELTIRKDFRCDFSQLENHIHTEDNLYISHFFNALSLATPFTEGILIRTIREAQSKLEGSGLESDAKAFIGQEATHTREHRALNKRLETLGFNPETVLKEIEADVKNLENRMSLRERLALVVTGEHAIYSIARALLDSDYPKRKQQSEVKKLFVWHCLEEMEHQSVCDDIYTHIYGRGLTHKLFHFKIFISANGLLVRMIRRLMKALLQQSREPRKGELREFIVWLMLKPGIGLIAVKELAGFFLPTFAHWKRQDEDTKLISDHLDSVYR